MKSMRFITIVLLAVFIIFGWFSFLGTKGTAAITYKNNLEQADKWVEERLYQRAILKYKEALEYKNKKETWKKLFEAYEKRYAEDESIFGEYVAVVEDSVEVFPKDKEFVEKLVNLYIQIGNTENAYKCLIEAEENGIKDENLYELKNSLKYSFHISMEGYVHVMPISNNTYVVQNGDKWGEINMLGEGIVSIEQKYLSSSGDDGIKIYTSENDSRLINQGGMVLGIFDFEVVESGVFSEGLIAVKNGDQYAYYDEFAKKQFGEFDFAGKFQGGKAAVVKDGKCFFINNSGEKISEDFYKIVMDANGSYTKGVASCIAKEEGKYYLYDEKLKRIGGFDAEALDICTEDNIIAYKKDGKWGFVDSEGNVAIVPEYDEAKSFSNGLAAVCKDGKWGFINRANELVIDYQFAMADYFNAEGSCMVRTDGANVDDGVLWQRIVLELGLL